jgi:hypothetical protein
MLAAAGRKSTNKRSHPFRLNCVHRVVGGGVGGSGQRMISFGRQPASAIVPSIVNYRSNGRLFYFERRKCLKRDIHRAKPYFWLKKSTFAFHGPPQPNNDDGTLGITDEDEEVTVRRIVNIRSRPASIF